MNFASMNYYTFSAPGEGVFFMHIKWKIASKSGKTGVVLRTPGPPRSSEATTDQSAAVCVVQTGNADIQLGSESAPVITDLAVADACAGTTQGITATVTGTYTGINWELKKNGATSTDGTITVGASKELASVAWGTSASGTYEICGTPQSSVAGAVPFVKT